MRANRGFYDAFEALDIERMRAVWLDAPYVKCIHPGSDVLLGAERVLASWKAIFENTASIAFEIADVRVELAGSSAWVSCEERIRATKDDNAPPSITAATNLFVLDRARWKLVLHHASPIHRRFT